MSKLVLIRHGQSQWNLENRFTGWVDIPLSPQGREEARAAGREIKHIAFDRAFTSKLIRAVETLLLVLGENGGKTPVFVPETDRERLWGDHYPADPSREIPVERVLALNERYYGDLQGLNKEVAAAQWGREQVQIWRRSFDQAPPGGESLKDTVARVVPFFQQTIAPRLLGGEHILVAAHGNSLRAIIMELERMSPDTVRTLEIPTGRPRVYNVDNGASGEAGDAGVLRFKRISLP
ncbi:MAG: 2,3-bisphosphoglycerate-dependent phosphoglycerate mutase [Desulfobacterota bacterium]|nr:2,3-bisphosphoglycerate-dependent phosphoglycerate mutase [Thermodesulfobacteriota bacterium]